MWWLDLVCSIVALLAFVWAIPYARSLPAKRMQACHKNIDRLERELFPDLPEVLRWVPMKGKLTTASDYLRYASDIPLDSSYGVAQIRFPPGSESYQRYIYEARAAQREQFLKNKSNFVGTIRPYYIGPIKEREPIQAPPPQ